MWRIFDWMFVLGAAISLADLVAGRVTEEEALIHSEVKLLGDLFQYYHQWVRPVKKINETLNVTIRLSLQGIESLDESRHALTTHVWLHLKWNDYRLAWNASDYDGLTTIRVPPSKIWTPDIHLYNSLDSPVTWSTLPLIDSKGNIVVVPPQRLRSSCFIDITKYPFDTQKCMLKFGSWTYNGDLIALNNGSSTLDTSTLPHNVEFDVIDTSVVKNVMTYSCCPEPYHDVTFYLTLRRRSAYATHLFVGPSVVLALLIPFVFVLPPDSKEKLVFGVGILIGHVLLFGQLEGFIPNAYPRLPIIAVFFLTNILLVCLSLALSTIVVNMWNRSHRKQTVPSCINTVFLGIFGRLLCVSRDDYMPSDNETDIRNISETSTTGDKDNMLKNYTQLTSVAEWRQLAVVLDRMLCVVFLCVVIIVAAAMGGG